MAIKGISLNISGDGESVSYSEGYEVKESLFVKLRDLFESYKETKDPETLESMDDLIWQVPDPNRRETHIGINDLILLKEIWEYINGKQGK